MTMTIEIRRATAGDVPVVAALEQELVRGDAPGDPYLVRALQRDEVEDQYRTLIAADWAVRRPLATVAPAASAPPVRKVKRRSRRSRW